MWPVGADDPLPVCSAGLPNDLRFMRRAIALAASVGEETVFPNPRVGALIVECGVIVSEGFHPYDGGPHAERVALEQLARAPIDGAEMYVTMEPCSTHGRTGACCERIIQSRGIRRVVIGCIDPNPAHAGRGVERLRSNGIEVVCGVEGALCEALNPKFNHRMRAK